jgi:hypothetical protein
VATAPRLSLPYRCCTRLRCIVAHNGQHGRSSGDDDDVESLLLLMPISLVLCPCIVAMRGALIKLRREEFVEGTAHPCQCALAAMMDVPTMPSHEKLIVGMV